MLIDLGLLRQDGRLVVANPIYREVRRCIMRSHHKHRDPQPQPPPSGTIDPRPF
jgi:hypothetical protein